MYINPNTLIFEGLTKKDKMELIDIVTALVLQGKVPPMNHYLIRPWLDVAAINDSSFLLMITTVFPARALLSVI